MKKYFQNDFYVLEMMFAKIASKDKNFVDEEYSLRRELCYCDKCKNNMTICGYCSGLENPRKKKTY